MTRFKMFFGLGIILILSSVVFALVPSEAEGAVPKLINFQGILKTPGGQPVADASYSVTFRIYEVPAGGTLLWAETTSVTTANGLFAILLGASNPVPDTVFKGSDRWLGIAVAPDPEMTPRQQLVSVGYGYRVSSVDGALGGNILTKVSIGPGHTNTGTDAFVAGANNTVSGNYSTAAGQFNNASNDWATVAGGTGNTASGITSTVGGGQTNIAINQQATVGGGALNTASGSFATVAGGNSNTSSGASGATVGGGSFNNARGQWSVVSGGGGGTSTDSNSALGDYSAIGGGVQNIASGVLSTIGGGGFNNATLDAATVSGGSGNTASGVQATISGGENNLASDFLATIGGGGFNVASASRTTIGGGQFNRANDLYATVGGGLFDTASGQYSTVPGGYGNRASGNYSFAAGIGAKAKHRGTFVWADSSTSSDFGSTSPNQFLIRAANVGIGTNSPTKKLEVAGSIKVGASDTVFSSNLSSNSPLTLQAPAGTARISVSDVSGNVGIGTTSPANKLDVEGGAVVGVAYSGTNIAPTNGLLVQGSVGIGTTSPNSPLHVQGPIATAITTVVANTTLDATHSVVLVDAIGAARTITLPSPAGLAGRQYTIKKTDGTANTVTVSPSSGTIDGAGSYVLPSVNKYVVVVSNGSHWWIVANN